MKVTSYDFDIESQEFTMFLPVDTQILTASIEAMHRTARLWVVCDCAQPMEARHFVLATTARKTNFELPDGDLHYIVSFAPPQSNLMFHLFEREFHDLESLELEHETKMIDVSNHSYDDAIGVSVVKEHPLMVVRNKGGRPKKSDVRL